MPDTGAPWNIPYVEAADLVSDWPADSLALANAIDAGLDASRNAGIGSNVVQAVKTDTFSTTSGSFVDVTGLTVTITPTSASSKVLLLWSVMASHSSGVTGAAAILMPTQGTTELIVPDSPGSRYPAAANLRLTGLDGVAYLTYIYSGMLVHSPSTTSPTEYRIRGRVAVSGSCHINRSNTDTDDATYPRGTSQLIAIEVAA